MTIVLLQDIDLSEHADFGIDRELRHKALEYRSAADELGSSELANAAEAYWLAAERASGAARLIGDRYGPADPPDYFGGPSSDTRHLEADIAAFDRDPFADDPSEGFGYWPGEDARPPRGRRLA